MASRQYNNDYPSVTYILGVLRKIGLEMWFKFNTAKFCDEKSERGKLIGTQIHEGIHAYIQNQEVKISTAYSEEVINALKGFALFRKEHPEFKLNNAEIALTSENYKYNGTMDVIAERNGVLIVGDWKTGEAKKKIVPDIYDEYKYQVAAYVKAYNEVNKTDIKQAFILSLAKDKIAYNFYEMSEQEINDCFTEAFLPALKIYNYQHKPKGEVNE